MYVELSGVGGYKSPNSIILSVYFCHKSDNDLWITVLEVAHHYFITHPMSYQRKLYNTFGESHVYIMEIAHGEDDKPLVGSASCFAP